MIQDGRRWMYAVQPQSDVQLERRGTNEINIPYGISY